MAFSSSQSPRGYEQITDMDPAVGLTVPDAGATFALIYCEGADVRWRDDGTDPTAAVGMLLADGEVLLYDGPLASIKFFETAAGAVVNVSYYA